MVAAESMGAGAAIGGQAAEGQIHRHGQKGMFPKDVPSQSGAEGGAHTADIR